MELCRGTGGGDGGSDGASAISSTSASGINLIHGNKNAFGGVYGPFFTPENGLVNPPAHMVIDVEPVVEGPVLCRYRMRGIVPDGLLPELRGKTIEIWWSFYHRSHWFVRSLLRRRLRDAITGGRVATGSRSGTRSTSARASCSSPPTSVRAPATRAGDVCGDPARAACATCGSATRAVAPRWRSSASIRAKDPATGIRTTVRCSASSRRTAQGRPCAPRSSASGARRTGSSGPIATTTSCASRRTPSTSTASRSRRSSRSMLANLRIRPAHRLLLRSLCQSDRAAMQIVQRFATPVG